MRRIDRTLEEASEKTGVEVKLAGFLGEDLRACCSSV